MIEETLKAKVALDHAPHGITWDINAPAQPVLAPTEH